MLYTHSIITFSHRISNYNEMLQGMGGRRKLVCYWLFLTTSLSSGLCPYGQFWTIRWFFWLVHQPVLPDCLWLWHSVPERPDAELGQASATLLLSQPSPGLNRDLLMCSSKINTPNLFFWPKSFMICIMHVFPSSELCCLPAEPWIPESKHYPVDRVRCISFKTCGNTHLTAVKGPVYTRKGHRLRQTKANLQLHRIAKAARADMKLSRYHLTQLRVEILGFGCLTEECREKATELSPTLPDTFRGAWRAMDHVHDSLAFRLVFWISRTLRNRPTCVCKIRTN